MSSFTLTAVNKTTQNLHKVWCIDDYFGRNQYGYIVIGLLNDKPALTEDEFYEQFEPKEPT